MSGPLGPACGAHCGTDTRGTAHCPDCHAGVCAAASDDARATSTSRSTTGSPASKQAPVAALPAGEQR